MLICAIEILNTLICYPSFKKVGTGGITQSHLHLVGCKLRKRVLPEVYSKLQGQEPPEVEHLCTIYSSFMASHITRNMLLVFLVWDKCLHNY